MAGIRHAAEINRVRHIVGRRSHTFDLSSALSTPQLSPTAWRTDWAVIGGPRRSHIQRRWAPFRHARCLIVGRKCRWSSLESSTLASKISLKVAALNLLVGAYDTQHLNDPKQVETALRELIVLTPNDLAPVFLLAKVQEDEGLIDAAKATLLDARHRQPDAVEPKTGSLFPFA
jgi:hypothetical protein